MNIISHRGANRLAPQNTIPAFKKSLEIGVDGFENDVHLTKDGVLVVCHNYDVDHTSNGSGNIADMTFEELRKLDFGSYFSPEFAGTQIPTLDEFLELCGSLKVINIEIKKPPVENSDIAKRTIDKVAEYGLLDTLLISSFDDKVLLDCRDYNPAVKTALLYSPDSPIIDRVFDDPFGFAKSLGCAAVHPLVLYVDEDYIEEAHSLGLMVNPWTVDKEFAIEKLNAIGCDGIITDLPDLARKVIYGE